MLISLNSQSRKRSEDKNLALYLMITFCFEIWSTSVWVTVERKEMCSSFPFSLSFPLNIKEEYPPKGKFCCWPCDNLSKQIHVGGLNAVTLKGSALVSLVLQLPWRALIQNFRIIFRIRGRCVCFLFIFSSIISFLLPTILSSPTFGFLPSLWSFHSDFFLVKAPGGKTHKSAGASIRLRLPWVFNF